MSTTVIGEETDLLMLLLHHKPVDQGEELYFRSDIQTKSQTNVYNIKTMKQILGDELCTHLLFLHAFTGCDSTSRIFGVGKKTVHQKFVKGHPVMTRCAQVFCSSGHDAGVVEESGRQAMISLFDGKSSDSLSSIRYSVLSKKVTTAHSFVTPERLPPTVSATTFHSRRAYYQVMTWMDMSADMDPTDWGWLLHDDKTQLVPIMMKKSPAPESLLKVVGCGCTTGCITLRCSCRKYGLVCAPACGNCQTDFCSNMTSDPIWEDDDE